MSPYFSNIMLHILVHLLEEVEQACPMHIKWLYFFERYMKTLKSMVDQKHYPREGHTPLCFVITCDNGVFNWGVFMHFLIIFPALFVDIKLL